MGARASPSGADARLSRQVLAANISEVVQEVKSEHLSLEPRIMKGDEYRKFLKDNEQAAKKLMGW